MTFFVTGASGFIGANLVKRLLNEGNTVFGLYRNKPDLTSPLLNVVIGKINQPSSYSEALKGCDIAYHCAAHIGFQKRDYNIAYRVNVEGTRTLLEACLNGNVKKVVHLSACAVLGYSDNPDRLIDESSNPIINSNNVYGYTKKLAEDIVYEYAAKGLDISIANIATVYGDGDNKMNSGSVIKMIYEGKARIIPPGGTSFVSVKDLVEGLILLYKRGKSGERYIFCTENMTYKELFQRIAGAIGVKRDFITVPKFFKYPAVLAARLAESIVPMSKEGVNLISSQIIRESFGFKYFDSTKARQHLGWETHQSLEDAVRSAFEYYRSKGLI